MQKGKLIIAGIVLTLSPALYAADTAEIIPAQEVVQAEGTPPLSDVSPMQDHVVEMIEKDFNFESQYRELVNQLALEKVRSELRKLRGEKKADSVAVMPVSTASTMDDISASPEQRQNLRLAAAAADFRNRGSKTRGDCRRRRRREDGAAESAF